MANINEILDSLNEENVSEIREQLKSEADALHKSNKQLYARAKRAEGFEYNNSKKDWVKKEPEKRESDTKPEELQKSNEPDYTKELIIKTFLKSEGVDHPDDQKIILDEAKRLKMEDKIGEVAQMEHIQAKIKTNKEKREVGDAMPSGKGKSGGDFKGEIDYWVDRRNPDGSYQTPEDTELAGKVIDARVRKEKAGNQFEPIRF